jgi:hypothetical protein
LFCFAFFKKRNQKHKNKQTLDWLRALIPQTILL